MAVLAVVSDAPGAGKTAVSSALARLARDGGKTAAVYKPVGPADDPDPAAYDKLLGQAVNGAARLTGGEPLGEAISGIQASAADLASSSDLVIVEVSSALSESDSATARRGAGRDRSGRRGLPPGPAGLGPGPGWREPTAAGWRAW